MAWHGGDLVRAVITSKLGGVCRVRTYDPVKLMEGDARPAEGPNPNPLFQVVEAGKPKIASGAVLPPLQRRPD
jgi:alpha-L-fucosidase 2